MASSNRILRFAALTITLVCIVCIVFATAKRVREPFWESGGYAWAWQAAVFVVGVLLAGTLLYLVALKRRMRATLSLIDHHTEAMVAKDGCIKDLQKRLLLITGEGYPDINIFRRDYRIEYVTPEWEAKYGPGVGQYCYKYFADRDEPCELCSLREAIKNQRVSSIKKSFPRESGRPLEVTTIPLVKDKDGVQLFGQTYRDVLSQNREAALAAVSQEREIRYLLLKGIARQSRDASREGAVTLQKMYGLLEEDEPSRKVDLNRTVRDVVKLTSHAWEHVAKVSLNLAEKSPLIEAAPSDVKMVVANLIHNAVYCLENSAFSAERKGTITLSTQVTGGSVFLMVVDNGTGFRFTTDRELSAEPGQKEDQRKDFIKLGLSPAYHRVFEKWNSKIRISRTEEERNLRTIVMQRSITKWIIPSLTNAPGVPEVHEIQSY